MVDDLLLRPRARGGEREHKTAMRFTTDFTAFSLFRIKTKGLTLRERLLTGKSTHG